MTFEHKIVPVGGFPIREGGEYPRGPVTMRLDAEAIDGWHLVGILSPHGSGIFAVFAREKGLVKE